MRWYALALIALSLPPALFASAQTKPRTRDLGGALKGINDHEAIALPHDRLRAVLKKYNRREK